MVRVFASWISRVVRETSSHWSAFHIGWFWLDTNLLVLRRRHFVDFTFDAIARSKKKKKNYQSIWVNFDFRSNCNDRCFRVGWCNSFNCWQSPHRGFDFFFFAKWKRWATDLCSDNHNFALCVRVSYSLSRHSNVTVPHRAQLNSHTLDGLQHVDVSVWLCWFECVCVACEWLGVLAALGKIYLFYFVSIRSFSWRRWWVC